MFQTLFLSASLCVGQPSGDLIKQLGHPHFAVRSHAHERLLRNMDVPLYFRLKKVKTDDPEVNARIRLIREYFAQKAYAKFRPRFTVDLMGYPKYPWILEGFPYVYSWQGLTRQQIVDEYLVRARSSKTPCQGPPLWEDYRLATRLWTDDRISMMLHHAIATAESEAQVHAMMEPAMIVIQFEIKAMIWGEDRYYGSRPNPLRATAKKKD